jgi:hypothetical protein
MRKHTVTKTHQISFGELGHQLLSDDNGRLVLRIVAEGKVTIGKSKQGVGGGDTCEKEFPQDIFSLFLGKGFLQIVTLGADENRETVYKLSEAGKIHFRTHDRDNNPISTRLNNDGIYVPRRPIRR